MASFNELQEASLGLTDKAVGLAKEAFGTLFSRSELAHAGRAQQDKGSERLDAIRHEAKADAARAKAALQERVQRSQQDNPRGGGSASESGPREGVSGVAERVKGQAKEAVGAIADSDRLRREGSAQQAKGEAKTEAAKEEAKAEKERAGVRPADARQQAAERADR